MKIRNLKSIAFEFLSEEVGGWTPEVLLAKEEIEYLPFFPLTDGGLERERLEPVLDQLHALEDKHLEGVSYVMASLAFLHYLGEEPE